MRRRRHALEDPHPSHPDPLYGLEGFEPNWRKLAVPRSTSPDEIPTYEICLTPHVVESSGSGHQGAHWLMALGHILDIASKYEVLFLMKQIWLPSTYDFNGDGWFGINLHNSPHDVGSTGQGGIGWGFGNGVSCMAWNLETARKKFCQHVEQVNDNSNGGAAMDYPLIDWPIGKWITLFAEIRFGRGDGTTKHTGYVKNYIDGQEVLNKDPITNVQRATNPANGQTYTQTLAELWDGGVYRIDVQASDPDVTYVSRQTLTQIGATLEECYADRPVPDKEWGVATPVAGYNGATHPTYSTPYTARTIHDLVLPQWAMDELGIDGGVTPVPPTPDADLETRVTVLEGQMAAIGAAATSVTPPEPPDPPDPPQPDLAIPNIPTSLTAQPGDTEVFLGWAANDPAEEVDYYQVYVDGDDYDLQLDETTAVVDGLHNGTPYEFRVSAHNAAGYGGWTDPVTCTPVADDVPVPPEPDRTVLATLGFEDGTFKEWSGVQDTTQKDGGCGTNCWATVIDVDPSWGFPGTKCAQLYVGADSVRADNSGKTTVRAQINAGDEFTMGQLGEAAWYEWFLRLPSDPALNNGDWRTWHTIFQHGAYTPGINLQDFGDGRGPVFRLTTFKGTSQKPRSDVVGDYVGVELDTTYRMRVFFAWANTPDGGEVEWWVDDNEVIPRQVSQTVLSNYDHQTQMNLDMYRDALRQPNFNTTILCSQVTRYTVP